MILMEKWEEGGGMGGVEFSQELVAPSLPCTFKQPAATFVNADEALDSDELGGASSAVTIGAYTLFFA